MIKQISKTKINKQANKKTNPELKQLILLLKKQKNPLWHQVAKFLARPRRKAIKVNLSKIEKFGEVSVIVPGKILSQGVIKKRLEIASFKISENARIKIKEAGSIYLSIKDLVKKEPNVKAKIII